jgi:hypothetical protein
MHLNPLALWRAVPLGVLFGVVAILGGVTILGPTDPSAPYFPGAQAASNPLVLAVTGSGSGGASSNPLARGPLTRPNAKLTPGAVAISNLTLVCRQPKHTRGLFSHLNPLISPAVSARVFSAYRIPVLQQSRYGLDFLIPLQLGGANVASNIWPMPSSRGFREKELLNNRMHVLVCHGDLPLDQAQQAMAADWVKLWVSYGV